MGTNDKAEVVDRNDLSVVPATAQSIELVPFVDGNVLSREYNLEGDVLVGGEKDNGQGQRKGRHVTSQREHVMVILPS